MYSIQKASAFSQIPASSIRYYEKIKLLPALKRNTNGVRVFDDKDIEILKLVKCFRRLGMPIQDIRENISNINLEYESIDTNAILLQHKKSLEEQIVILNSYIEEIENKM
ncbi:MerR family transcriptional regulator [Paenibacillus sp. Marseille-Q7038]